jgi:phage FluMu gp28-like protein
MVDKARFKMGLMCRQIGKSFIVALEVVDDALETGDDWVLLSAGERQSKELMRKVAMHCKAYAIAASDILTESYLANDGIKYNLLTICLPNGARIIGLPANPDTARGFTANVVLDEFAFHRDSKLIWRALYPTIARGYKIRVVTTPQGLGNKAHSLWTSDNNWSKHFVDIYKAVEDGAPHNIQELREGIDDEEAWQQEFECLFIDDSSTLLNYELISSCMDQKLEPEISYEDFDLDAFNPEIKGELYNGLDIGRKHDRSISWTNELLGDVYWNRLILVMNKIKFREQQSMQSRLIRKLGIRRSCIDQSGIGAQLAEDTIDELGMYRVEGVDFTNAVKADLAVRTLRTFEDKRIRIPVSKVLRDDLHSVKKSTTAAGNIRYDSERTKEGHADRFWGLSLSLMASEEATVPEVILL